MDATTTNTNTNSMIITTLQQRTLPTKITKPKKKRNNKPIKVVYISNPMKVKTSASEFRALVQELTGQYAESPPDPSRFQEFGDDDNCVGRCDENRMDLDKNDRTVVVVPPHEDLDQVKSGGSSYESFEGFDDVLSAQMVENIWDLLPTDTFCESFQLDQY